MAHSTVCIKRIVTLIKEILFYAGQSRNWHVSCSRKLLVIPDQLQSSVGNAKDHEQ